MPSTHDTVPPGATPAASIIVEERVARALVSGHRARLLWLLRVPEWAELYEQGVVALQLPGRRQGIRLETALDSLALEHKHQLVRWAVTHFNRHLSRAIAQRLCAIVGLERFSEVELDSALTLRQWGRLRDALLFRLAREHARYKHAQQWLFVTYHPLVDGVVGQIVFAQTHRADCAQEGRVALLQAIDRVDTEGDFAAYAASWIRRAVRNHLIRQRLPVHTPVNLVVRAAAARGAAGLEADPADTSRLEAVVLEMLRQPSVLLDREPADGEPAVAEILADPEAADPAGAADRADLRDLVARGLGALTDKQRQVLVQRYGLDGGVPRTLVEIARAAGISHQQVSMRERRALERLETSLAAVVAEYDGNR